MKTIITSTDKATIEKGFKNPSGMIISTDKDVRVAVADHAKSIIKALQAARNSAK